MARVLLIEDGLDTVQTLAYLLRDSGHQVEFAINGYMALEIAPRFCPQVILLDIGLPDFDGCLLARRLRRLPGLDDVRIIAVTGRVSDDEQRARDAGCEAFLRKPVLVDTLDSIIRSGPRITDVTLGVPKHLN